MPTNDPLRGDTYQALAALDEQDAVKLRSNLQDAATLSPDAEVGYRKIAEAAGVPVDAVRALPDESKRVATMARLDSASLIRDTPALARQLQKPEFAAVAHDDLDGLQAFERKLTEGLIGLSQGLQRVGDVGSYAARSAVAGATYDFGAAAYGWLEGMAKYVAGNQQPGQESLPGIDQVAEWLAARRKGAEAKAAGIAGAAPTDLGFTAQGIVSGTRSFGQMAPATLMSVLTGSPAPALAAAGVTQGGQSVVKGLETPGVSPGKALAYGVEDAAAEIATEMLPVAKFVKDVRAGAPFLKILGAQIVREVPTELAATAWQNFNEWANIHPEQPFSTYLDSLPEAEAQTVIATVTTTLLMAGAGGGINAVAGKRQASITNAETGAKLISELMDAAKATELLARDPASLRSYFQTASENGPLENVWLNPKELTEAGVDVGALAKVSPSFAAQMTEALAVGGDVRIPTAELLTTVPNTELEEAVIQHLHTQPDEMSLMQAKTYAQKFDENLAAEVEQGITKGALNGAFAESSAKVEAELLAQLEGARRFTTDVNKVFAKYGAATYATMASRLGKMPEELYVQYPLRITGEQPAVPAKGRVSTQQVKKAQPEDFARGSVKEVLGRQEWAILTPENPNAQALTPEANAARMAQMKAMLDAESIQYEEIQNQYGGTPEHSLILYGVPESYAMDIGRRFGQESVLTPRGLVYQDATYNPAVGVTEHEAPPGDFFSVVPRTGAAFTVDINFDERLPMPPSTAPLVDAQRDLLRGWSKEVATANEALDEGTRAHEHNVAALVGQLARTLGLPKFEAGAAVIGAMAHDVGKAGTFTPVMLSAASLTPEEFALVREHPAMGAKVLAEGGLPEKITNMVGAHHLNFNEQGGYGVPIEHDQFKTDLLHAADVFTSIATTDAGHKYRKANMAEALKVLAEGKGTKYNPVVVDAITRIVEAGRLPPTFYPPGRVNNVVAIHFSREARPVLDTWHYGTGMKGAEAKRLANATDSRIRQRLTAYVANENSKVFPESGIGYVPHAITVSNLYDAEADPLELFRNPDLNAAESAVLDHGFDGYVAAHVLGQQGTLVLLGSRTVDARVLDGLEEANEIASGLRTYGQSMQRVTIGGMSLGRGIAPMPGTGEEVTVITSPTRDAAEVMAKRSAAGSIRGFRDEFGTLHVWDASRAIHQQVMRGMGMPEEGIFGATGIMPFTRFEWTVEDLKKLPFGTFSGEGTTYGQPSESATTLTRMALDHFGTTTDAREAGYITPTGRMLDLSGRHEAAGYERQGRAFRPQAGQPDYLARQRATDHRDLPEAVYDALGVADATEAMLAFQQATKMIRFDSNSGISAPFRPTREHVEYVVRAWKSVNGNEPMNVDVEDSRGNTVASVEVERPTVDRVLAVFRNALPTEKTQEKALRDELSSITAEKAAILRREGSPSGRSYEELTARADAITAQLEERTLAQGEAANRGTTTFGANIRETPTVIALLHNANLSTFLHEMAHFQLEMLVDMAGMPDAPVDVRADAEKLLNWMGVNGLDAWNAMPFAQKERYHEQLARGMEAYLFEGKAPSTELNATFARIRSWMLAVYRHFTNILQQFTAQFPGQSFELSDEVRGVFDRLLATEQEIADKQVENAYAPMFESAAQAGMTAAEWQHYREQQKLATETAVSELAVRGLRDMKWLTNARSRLLRALQKDAQAKRAEIEREVTTEVRQQPIYRALHWLKTGELTDAEGNTVTSEVFKLDTAIVLAEYPELKGVLSNTLQGLTSPDGLAPDLVAEMMGLSSGDELIRKIVDGVEPEAQLIERETNQRALLRYGDLVTQTGIDRAADEAIHNDVRARFVSTEMAMLDRALGNKRTTATVAKDYAETLIARQKVRTLRPSQYSNAAVRAGKAAGNAFKAGDIAAAATEKRNQLINTYAAKAAHSAAEEIAKNLRYLKGVVDSDAISVDYRNQIANLLERFDLRPLTVKELNSRESLLSWVEAQKAEGLEPVVDESLLDEARRVSYKNMTVEEFRGLVDTVKNVEHLGRLKKRLLTAKDDREFAARVSEAADSVAANARKTLPTELESNTWLAHAKHGVKEFFAMHHKFSNYMRLMDGVQDGGVMWELLSRPMNEAGDTEAVMREQATIRLAELFKPVLAQSRMTKKTYIPEIGASLSHEGRIMVALNTGTDGNLQRLMDGDGWTAEQVKAITDTLTREDWTFVQGVLDFVGSYKDQIGAQQLRLTGLEPEWVEPKIIHTPFGDLPGGYFPAKYDINRSTRSMSLEAAQGVMDQWRARMGKPTTRASFTKARAKKVVERPLRKDFGVITQHVSEVTHRLAWQDYLTDARRLLAAGQLDSAIRTHYGPEVVASLRQALEDVAAGDLGAQNAFEAAISHVRQGATIVGLGYRLTTALLQPMGLTQSMVRIGPKWVGKGLAEWLGDAVKMENTAKQIYAKSDMMRLRGKTLMREISEIRNQVESKNSAITASYFYLIQKLQLVADIPTWLGEYHKAIEQDGADEATAVARADQAVLDAQGGGQVKDLSAIQRGGPMLKLFTNFYSFFNTTFNLTSESVARTNFRDPVSVGRMATDLLLLYVVPAVLGTLMKAALKGDDDPEKLAKQLASDQLQYMLGTVVGLREVGGAMQALTGLPGYDYQGPASLRLFSSLSKLSKQLSQGEVDAALLKAANEVGGILFHYPAGQINATIEGLVALSEGKTQNPGALVVGPPRD